VHKHAPGARVTVQVGYEESGLQVTIRNTPSAGQPNRALAETGSGLGIASLRHRVELLHGTLRAGPAADGGFCVEATLPSASYAVTDVFPSGSCDSTSSPNVS